MGDATSTRRRWLLLRGAVGRNHSHQHGRCSAVLPLSLLWLLYRLPEPARQIRGMILCGAVAALVMSPWLVRNYEVFGKFVFVRDNLPLEMHRRTMTASRACGRGTSIPETTRGHAAVSGSGRTWLHGGEATGVPPVRARAPSRFRKVHRRARRIFLDWHAASHHCRWLRFDCRKAHGISDHDVLAFGGLWLSFRNKKARQLSPRQLLADLSASLLPCESLSSL